MTQGEGTRAGDRRPTSVDVARRAQVSQSAVSRTFTPGASVSEDTRRRVMEAAEALGYLPNRLPGMLQKDKTGIVSVVAGSLQHPFHTLALDHIAAALRAAGKFVNLVRADDIQDLDSVVGELVGYRVDAVITALAVRDPETAAALDRFGVPVVRFQSGAPGRCLWTITSDNEDQGRRAARHLLEVGCRRFAFMAGEGSFNQDLRRKGFVETLEAEGHEVRCFVAPGHVYAAGVAGAAQLFEGAPIDGLLCGNDSVALGVLDEARRRGVRVPDDLKVVGCDNIEQGGWAPYGLTTFDQRTDRIAAAVVAMLDDGMPEDREVFLPMDFIRRDTA